MVSNLSANFLFPKERRKSPSRRQPLSGRADHWRSSPMLPRTSADQLQGTGVALRRQRTRNNRFSFFVAGEDSGIHSTSNRSRGGDHSFESVVSIARQVAWLRLVVLFLLGLRNPSFRMDIRSFTLPSIQVVGYVNLVGSKGSARVIGLYVYIVKDTQSSGVVYLWPGRNHIVN
ncbi:hypothetical protein PanWU01x14_262650 [Parasponia andersonii]|uniref:Uncharacterized protein n=1 Tax=Parasponia andersonii TaxID=3476 RepID=A0A2P5B847_PARAD|nr:hypothetical protein PanWU01x14_262650 [Parasponia andersonii]